MVSSLLWIMLTVASAAGQSGWLDVHALDDNWRLDVMLHQNDPPSSHMTYQRVDGGIGP